MTLRSLATLFTAVTLAAPATARAQSPAADFPPPQIRIVVPFTAGGGTDVITRPVSYTHLTLPTN